MTVTLPNVPTEVDLMIVGAGPTGLFTALLAERLGLSVCIIDKAQGPLEFGRADALNARTQEYIELAGVLGDLEPFAIKCDTISSFSNGKVISSRNHWWRNLKHTHYRSFMIIGQPDIERAALAHLRKTTVHFSSEATSITEDAHGAVTTFGAHEVHSKFVIGADGARSFARASMGVKFLGSEPGIKEAVIDAEIETDFPVRNDIIAFEKDGKARVSFIPRERGLARFYVLVDGAWTQESIMQDIREYLVPYKIEFKRVEWISSFEVKERVASSFISTQHHRILLAGDAAHTSSANGAQGMNTGVADAFALTWRLNLAIKTGNLSILQSYSDERRRHASNYVKVAAKLVRSTLKTAEEYVGNIETSADFITGMGIKYSPGDLVEAGSLDEFVSGHRCPDFDLVALHPLPDRDQPAKNTLYKHLVYGKFVTLLFNHAVMPSMSSNTKELVETWQVTDSAHTVPGQKLCAEYFQATSEFLGKQGVVVIRPDLYVGYAGSTEGATEYFKMFESLMARN